MKVLRMLGLSICLSGCQTVAELEYRKTAPDANWDAAEANARDGFEYVELQKTYIKVGLDDSGKGNSDTISTDAGSIGKDKAHGSVSEAKSSAPADGKAVAKNKAYPSASKGSKAAPTAGEKTSKDSATTKDGDTSAAREPTDKAPKDITSPPAMLDPVLATSLIDGRVWSAKTVPVPSAQMSFLVRGQTGSFWKVTTLSVAKYANSDLTSGVSVKAENLVATRIGQAAGIVAKLVTTAGAIGVSNSSNTPLGPLLPFSLEIGDKDALGDLNDGWTYKLKFDDVLPKNVVNFSDFLEKSQGKKVNYWPVPACRSATLSVFGGTLKYEFRVIVASPTYVRLQPVPVDGKITPGSICSSSTTGTMTIDPMTNLTDQVAALQTGVQTIKDVKKGDSETDDQPKDDKGKDGK